MRLGVFNAVRRNFGMRCYMRLGVRNRIGTGSQLDRNRDGSHSCRWIRHYMRLGVSCLMHELGVTCGSACSVGAPDLRRIPYTMRLGVRNLAFETFRIAYTMRLGVAWASSVNGFRCGSASLGRCLSLNLDAARRRLGDGF